MCAGDLDLDEVVLDAAAFECGNEVSAEAGAEAPWLPRSEICLRLGLQAPALYRLIQAGDLAIARDGTQLLYRRVQPSASRATKDSASEGRDAALSAEDYVAALAGFADTLSQRLCVSERRREAAQCARDRAIDMVREATDEHAALSRQHQAAVRQLGQCQRSLKSSRQALRESDRHQQRLVDRLRELTGGLLALAQSSFALPIRGRLMSLLASTRPIPSNPIEMAGWQPPCGTAHVAHAPNG